MLPFKYLTCGLVLWRRNVLDRPKPGWSILIGANYFDVSVMLRLVPAANLTSP